MYIKWYIRCGLDGILKVGSWYIKWYAKTILNHIVMVYQMEY